MLGNTDAVAAGQRETMQQKVQLMLSGGGAKDAKEW